MTGTFTDRDSAERTYNSMLSRGYSEKDINLMMSDEKRKQDFADENKRDTELGNKAMENAGVGGTIGGTVGAILAAIATVGASIAIPGLGGCRAACGGTRRGGSGGIDGRDHRRVDRQGAFPKSEPISMNPT